ncbi:MAG: acyloxyacyl hydrolase [Betaproteobacteria bacterium]|nr:acyloxyacyl hydrolase [Betaproteobacteria bacterium]
MNKNCWLGAAAAAAILSLAGPARAVDGVSVELGNGDSTDMWRVGAQWNWEKKWFTGGNWHLGGYWDVSLGAWDSNSSAGGNNNIVDLGVTPVFRFQQKTPSGIAPYLEGAIGFHLLSKSRVNADRALGSAFQFGDHVGVGIRFGSGHEFDLSYRFQHLSNGSIKQPNQGISFNQIRFQYHF